MEKELIIATFFITISVIIAVCLVIKHVARLKTPIGIDAIVGEKCMVTETIDNFAGCGQIKVKGQLWSARGFFEDDIYERGESLRIVAIEGAMVVCKKD